MKIIRIATTLRTITYSPFLKQIVAYLQEQPTAVVEQSFIIFPTQISIDYFQSLLMEVQSPWTPTCMTLQQLILAHSGLTAIPDLVLLGELYALTNQLFHRQWIFEQFCPFGRTFLQDFNELDQYLIPIADFFLSLKQQKQLTVPLTVQHFIHQNTLLYHSRDSSLFQEPASLLFWEKLPLLYQAFTEKLLKQGQGYNGLCYRIASHKPLTEPFAYQLIFAGFNLLTPAEEAFIIQCQRKMPVQLYWDTDRYYTDNALNVAGDYLRQHRQKTHFHKSFPTLSTTYFHDQYKEVVVREMDTMLTQIQSVIDALQATTEGNPTCPPLQTAIVISGSHLLLPLLDKMADIMLPLHFRLNYPLTATATYTLVTSLTELWAKSGAVTTLFVSSLAKSLVLLRPFVTEIMQVQIAAILQVLSQLTDDTLKSATLGPFVSLLNRHHKGLLDFLEEVLLLIAAHFTPMHNLFLALNKAALHYTLTYITSCRRIAGVADWAVTFLNLLKESKLPFQQNNPLTGLYIVEIAESHNLDFEHLFFINMGEGFFPSLNHRDSFLPYNLRKRFGLPLLDKETERTTAYGFYRLLQRAQHNYCSYTKQRSWGGAHEASRLLLQLTFDSKLKIKHQAHTSHYALSPVPIIVIEKDAAIRQALATFLVAEKENSARLTPSALITYLRCPLQFYFTYLLQVKPMLTFKDNSVQVGKLLHYVMGKLYQPFVGKQIDRTTLHYLASNIESVIEAALAIQLPEQTSTTLALYRTLLEKMSERILALDATIEPFILLGVEMRQEKQITIDAERKVVLSGIIDRVDRKANTIRIVDYKTGIANDRIATIAALFNRETIKNNSAIFQVLLYAWLFTSVDTVFTHRAIMPYLMNIRALFTDAYIPGITIQFGHTKQYERITDMQYYAKEFAADLSTLLLEIFNPTLPFTQTEDREICASCPYAAICRRD